MIVLAIALLLLAIAAPVQAQSVGFLGIDTGGSNDALTTISTQTASGSASLQFTGINSTYNTYMLDCTGLLASVAGTFFLYVGEGAGPTWETSATYTNQFLYTGPGASTGPHGENSTTATGTIDGLTNSVTVPMSFRVWLDNPSSTTLIKNVTFESPNFTDGHGEFYYTGAGYWSADTNAITGLELVPSTGNIASGVCTLYGLQK